MAVKSPLGDFGKRVLWELLFQVSVKTDKFPIPSLGFTNNRGFSPFEYFNKVVLFISYHNAILLANIVTFYRDPFNFVKDCKSANALLPFLLLVILSSLFKLFPC